MIAAASRVTDGEVARYIPELAAADPDDFGVSVVSVHGRSYAAGDAAVPFTIQSISKPFVYALAVTEHGLDVVERHVGFEPSGEAFNAISLEPGTGRPANAMINAGAIVTSALIDGASPTERFERIRRSLSSFAGRTSSPIRRNRCRRCSASRGRHPARGRSSCAASSISWPPSGSCTSSETCVRPRARS